MVTSVPYKVVDNPWFANDPASVETMLNGLGASGWSLAVAYVDPLRERTRWVFDQPPPPWPPTLTGGVLPTIGADFTGSAGPQAYLYNATYYSTFAAWLAAIGGTLTRASSATYLQGGVVKTATSNTARFPTNLNGSPQGIRLTGAVTNAIVQSSAPGVGAGWVPTAATVTQNATGPDGVASSAVTYIPNTTNIYHGVYQGSPFVTGTAASWTQQVFAKNAGYNFLSFDPFNLGSGATIYASFDLTTGVATQTGGTAAGTISLANGWFLCWFTYTNTAGVKAIVFAPSDTGGAPHAFVGNNTSGILLFGAQAAAVPYQVDYIPTTTVTATQAADDLNFPFTNTTFSALIAINGQQGVTASPRILAAIGNSNSFIYLVSSAAWTFNGSAQIGKAYITPASNPHKYIAAGSPVGRYFTTDGQAPASDANPLVLNTPTGLRLGNNAQALTANTVMNISQFACWNNVVASAADMQRLTT